MNEKKLFLKYNINLDEQKKLLFNNYANILVDKNKEFNLTAITEINEIWVKHFLDSGLIVNDIPNNVKVLDVGTGAGFPGVPLKILNDSLNVTLLDSLNKRVNFLNELIEKLNLQNITSSGKITYAFGILLALC